jgi:hypothetical protein
MEDNEKLSVEEVAEIVDCEGLDYAIQHYMGPDSIEDPNLAMLWADARETLAAIEKILYPDGIEAWHNREDEDDESDDEEYDDEDAEVDRYKEVSDDLKAMHGIDTDV